MMRAVTFVHIQRVIDTYDLHVPLLRQVSLPQGDAFSHDAFASPSSPSSAGTFAADSFGTRAWRGAQRGGIHQNGPGLWGKGASGGRLLSLGRRRLSCDALSRR